MENKPKTDIEIFTRQTDINYTKKVSVKGKQPFTNIDTYYLIQSATEEFGLFGNGWGFKSLKWETITIGDTILAKLEAIFFFPNGEFPITNSDKLAYKTKGYQGAEGYMKIDEEVYKKIETNTIAKALSRIGFGTDVYMGKFEDFAYTDEIINDLQLCNADSLKFIRELLQKNSVSAEIITKHFGLRALTELKYKNFNEAVALVDTIKGK